MGARWAIATEVILTLQFRLPLAPFVDGEMVAVIVEDFLAATNRPDDFDDNDVAVANSRDVGVARVIDQAQDGHGRATYFS